MNLYYVSLAASRTDVTVLESKSLAKAKNLLSISKSIIRNIKLIEYSKEYNLNYAAKSFTSGATYKKVLVSALSKNKSKIFSLFNVKKSITEDEIKKQFKTLYIEDEPIIDFTSIQFFVEGDERPTIITNLYQVQYKRLNKTYVEDLYSKDYRSLLKVCEKLIDGEITEIRKYLHLDKKVLNKALLNCYHRVSIKVTNEDSYRSFSITNVKNSLTPNQIEDYVIANLTIQNQTINRNNIKINIR